MSATAAINTPERPGNTFALPMAAATLIYAGTLVAIDAAGRAVPAANTAGLRVLGRAEDTFNNSGGAADAINAVVKRGIFLFPNSATAAVDPDDVGKYCYVEDDQTVAETTTNKVVAGRVMAVESGGVWVDTGHAGRVPSADTITGAADLAALKVALLAILQAQALVK